jgi:hypothetical protein
MNVGHGIGSIKRLISKYEDGTIDEVGYAHLCDLIARREVQLRALTKRDGADRGCAVTAGSGPTAGASAGTSVTSCGEAPSKLGH